MYIHRSNLDREFLKNLRQLEKNNNVIVLLEYIGNECYAHCFNANLCEMEFAIFKIGTRQDTKERWYINLSKELATFKAASE